MPPPKPRVGAVLQAKGRALPFSFFPVTRGSRRYGLYDSVFAVSPWSVMNGVVVRRLKGTEQLEAQAFLKQAADFYRAASSGVSTNPVLTYYAFVNLAKALIRVRGYDGSFDRAMHGLTERTRAGGTELRDSEVVVRDSGASVNLFPEVIERLGYPRPRDGDSYRVLDLLPQVVIGHRIWRESGAGHSERFVDLKDIEFVDDREAKQLWLRVYVSRGDLSRYDIPRRRLIDEGGLSGAFREVDLAGLARSEDLVCLEQTEPVRYTGRPTDVVVDLVELMKPRLWRIVSALPNSGYRRYYLHLTPVTEPARLPQFASLWALFFYFGSVVRYRPHLFDELLRDQHGAFVEEFISAQPEQMLYLLASELCSREIARPAIA